MGLDDERDNPTPATPRRGHRKTAASSSFPVDGAAIAIAPVSAAMPLLGAGTCVRLFGARMQVDDDGAQSAAPPNVPSSGSAASEAGCGFLLAATIALL